uniref:Uncharacterized protein n=1 Tax=Arundo donax TaxID=35708 RepID=A0A0A8Y6C8_ARUDO
MSAYKQKIKWFISEMSNCEEYANQAWHVNHLHICHFSYRLVHRPQIKRKGAPELE